MSLTLRWTLLLTLLLAACRPAPATVTPTTLVGWNRSPQAVVFRAEIVGGESDFRARSAIPNCTIYGDNRVVWINELGPFQLQVLEDRLTDSAIDQFVQYLAAQERIYTFGARLDAIRAQADVNPVVERVTLTVNEVEHQADSFGGWDADWFPRVLKACKDLSAAPVLVAPTSGWVYARSVPFSMAPPVTAWDAAALGLSLSSVADGGPHWIDGAAASTLWNTLHSLPDNVIFEDGSAYFEVALQVPGVTRDAPPPGS